MGLIVDAYEGVVERHQLGLAERAVLTHLLLMADHRTGEYRSTLEALAGRVGLHPARLRPKLARLAEVGLIEYSFPRGHEGVVTVSVYDQLVYLAPSQRAERAERNARSARSATRGFVRCDLEDTPDPQRAERALCDAKPRVATSGFTMSTSVVADAAAEEAAPPADALPAVPDVVVGLCDALADAIAARGSKRPTVTRAWLTDMDRLVRLDGRDPDDVARVIRWLAAGRDETADFWQPNIRSPKKLRARWDQMREQHQARARRRNTRQQQTDQAWADTQVLQQAIANGDLADDFNPLDAVTGGTQ